MRKFILTCVVCSSFLFVNFSFASCIGVVTAGSRLSFWDIVIKGAETAGKELGVEVYARGPMNEGMKNAQERIIQTMIKHGCRGLVVAPGTFEAAEQAIKSQKNGLPVIYIDRLFGEMPHLGLVGTDNLKAGYDAGLYMANKLRPGSKVAVLGISNDVPSTSKREKGFIKAAKEKGLEVSLYKHLGLEVGQIRDNARLIFSKLANVQGIFTSNELTTTAILLLRRESNDKTIHVGFDSNELHIKSIKNGTLDSMVVQKPHLMGYLAVKSISKALSGKLDRGKFVDTGVKIVNLENLNSSEVQELLKAKGPR